MSHQSWQECFAPSLVLRLDLSRFWCPENWDRHHFRLVVITTCRLFDLWFSARTNRKRTELRQIAPFVKSRNIKGPIYIQSLWKENKKVHFNPAVWCSALHQTSKVFCYSCRYWFTQDYDLNWLSHLSLLEYWTKLIFE